MMSFEQPAASAGRNAAEARQFEVNIAKLVASLDPDKVRG
jgi:hypothetical protein